MASILKKIHCLEKGFSVDDFFGKSLQEKCSYSELFWSVFSAFGLNTERYSVSLRIQSECGKIGTRITPNTDTFYAVNVMESSLIYWKDY